MGVSFYSNNLVLIIYQGYFLLFYFSEILQIFEKSQKSGKVKKQIVILTKKFLLFAHDFETNSITLACVGRE